MSRPRLVLASSSPRRVALLAQLGLTPDTIVDPCLDEARLGDESPRAMAVRLAIAKCVAGVALAADADALVLAGDTIAAAGHRVLPKAETEDQARACLTLLSGRRHHVFSAVALAAPGWSVPRTRCGAAVVALARLTPAQIDAYLADGEWRGKAGGYALQGKAAGFVRFLSGSPSAVIGLPLFETAALLRGVGYLRP